jgi:hypothetical protein
MGPVAQFVQSHVVTVCQPSAFLAEGHQIHEGQLQRLITDVHHRYRCGAYSYCQKKDAAFFRRLRSLVTGGLSPTAQIKQLRTTWEPRRSRTPRHCPE